MVVFCLKAVPAIYRAVWHKQRAGPHHIPELKIRNRSGALHVVGRLSNCTNKIIPLVKLEVRPPGLRSQHAQNEQTQYQNW